MIAKTRMDLDTAYSLRGLCRAAALILVVLAALTGCVTVECYSDEEVSDQALAANANNKGPCNHAERGRPIQQTADLLYDATLPDMR